MVKIDARQKNCKPSLDVGIDKENFKPRQIIKRDAENLQTVCVISAKEKRVSLYKLIKFSNVLRAFNKRTHHQRYLP